MKVGFRIRKVRLACGTIGVIGVGLLVACAVAAAENDVADKAKAGIQKAADADLLRAGAGRKLLSAKDGKKKPGGRRR